MTNNCNESLKVQAAREILRRRSARKKLIDFVCYVRDGYQVNWHHRLLCEYLDRFISGEIKRLMVFMPPQEGKSELVSRALPAYILGVNPKAKIALASYSASLATSFNRDCQRIIDTEKYHLLFPQTFLNKSNVVTIPGSALRNSEIFETVGFNGSLKTVGVGGSLTGSPADFALIDDPVKDMEEATSSTIQMKVWEWYSNVLKTRIHNNSRILLTMTRWDTNDLAGKLLKVMEEGGEEWTVLSLPAICDEKRDYDPREIGDVLWPERHGLEFIDEIRRTNSRTFQSLYQQNPRPSQTGGEFYSSFLPAIHVRKVAYTPGLPIHISFDENVNPFLPIGIFQKIKIGNTMELRMIEEFCYKAPKNKLKIACRDIVAKYWNQLKHDCGCFIYGDATSQKEDVKQEEGHNLFKLAMQYLDELKPQKRVPQSNPSVVTRGLFINAILKDNFGNLSIVIDTNCKNAIEDFSFLKEDSDGGKLKEKAHDPITKASYERYGHMSDLTDYFICHSESSKYSEFKTGGKTSLPFVGNNSRTANHY